MCLVLKSDNRKVVSIANGQTHRVTQPSSTVLVYRCWKRPKTRNITFCSRIKPKFFSFITEYLIILTPKLCFPMFNLKPNYFNFRVLFLSSITCLIHFSFYSKGVEKMLEAAQDTEHNVMSKNQTKRCEAVWDLFQSECNFLYDHLMVLKNVSTLSTFSRQSATFCTTNSWYSKT